MDRLLTISAASEQMSLGRSKLYELIQAHEIRTVRIGRAVRIPSSELERWVRERLGEPTQPAA